MAAIYFKIDGKSLRADKGSVQVFYGTSSSSTEPSSYTKITTVTNFKEGEVDFSLELPTNLNDYNLFFKIIYASREHKTGAIGVVSTLRKSAYSPARGIVKVITIN